MYTKTRLRPAACASEGAAEYYRVQSYPRQVMSPNLSQTLSQDPFHMQVPSREADANVRTKDSSTECKDDDPTTSVPKMVPAKEDFFDVKEEFESGSPGSGNGTPAQVNQPSVLENERPHVPEQSHEAERPHEPEVLTHSQDIHANPPQVP